MSVMTTNCKPMRSARSPTDDEVEALPLCKLRHGFTSYASIGEMAAESAVDARDKTCALWHRVFSHVTVKRQTD